MNSFEHAKRSFTWVPDGKAFEIGPIEMELPYSPIYDDDELSIKLSQYVRLSSSTYLNIFMAVTRRDMKTLFDPSVEGILGLLDEQADLVGKKANKEIDVCAKTL